MNPLTISFADACEIHRQVENSFFKCGGSQKIIDLLIGEHFFGKIIRSLFPEVPYNETITLPANFTRIKKKTSFLSRSEAEAIVWQVETALRVCKKGPGTLKFILDRKIIENSLAEILKQRGPSIKLIELTRAIKMESARMVFQIPATKGRKTLADFLEMFPGGIDPDFYNFGLAGAVDPPTKKMMLDVHTAKSDAVYEEIFERISPNLDSLCLTQEQIIEFIKKDAIFTRQLYPVLCLYKLGHQYFVYSITVNSEGKLRFDVDRYDGTDYVWYGKLHVKVACPTPPKLRIRK